MGINTASASNLTLLTFDDVCLALPLGEVVTIGRTSYIQYGETDGQALGNLIHAGRRYGVYGLSSGLELLPELPSRRVFCACLEGDRAESGLALACDSVATVNLSEDMVLENLPECLNRTGTPLRFLLKYRRRLVLGSNATAVRSYINALENHDEHMH